MRTHFDSMPKIGDERNSIENFESLFSNNNNKKKKNNDDNAKYLK